MGRNAGARAARDTGSTTGVATAILALLSAGAMASISLVAAHQLAPAISDRLLGGESSAVRAPATVVVTPRAGTTPAGQGTTQRRATKPPTPADLAVAPPALTSSTPAGATRAIGTVATLRLPHVALPSELPARPALTTPAPTPRVPRVTTPVVPTDIDASTPPRSASTHKHHGRSHRHSSGCGEQAGRNHRERGHDDASGADRGRRAHGDHRGRDQRSGYGDDGGRRGHGHHGGSGDGGRHGGHGHDSDSADRGGHGDSQHGGHGDSHHGGHGH